MAEILQSCRERRTNPEDQELAKPYTDLIKNVRWEKKSRTRRAQTHGEDQREHARQRAGNQHEEDKRGFS